jgi:acyl carrier protein
MREAVREKAMDLLRELAFAKDPDLKVAEDSHIEQDLRFDSLDRLHLMVGIQARFGMRITAQDYLDRKLAIVRNLLDYIAATARI